MSTNISVQILDELFSTIEVVGVEKTIKSLRDAKDSILVVEDVDINFILNTVSELTGISKERILYGKDRSDERKIAVSLSVYFVKNHFLYSYPEIKKIFNKDASVLSRYNSYVENKPKVPKTEFDKKIDELSKKINFLLNQRKLTK